MYRRVLEKLRKSGLGAYLASGESNRSWLCRKENYPFPATLLFAREEVYVFTPSRNIESFRAMYPEYHVLPGQMAQAVEKCRELGLPSLGFESDLMPFGQYLEIKEGLPGCELIPAAGFIEDLRMIKTPEEIARIKEATAISDRAFSAFLPELRPGLTEREARALLAEAFYRAGADALSFNVLLSSGPRCFLPHAISTDRVLGKGELVLIDFGVIKEGYCSDTTRTVCLGRADALQRERYELVRSAQQWAVDHIRAGMPAGEADALARDRIMRQEPGGCYDYGLGHGIGLNVHEQPRMKPGSAALLPEHTAVSVEPGVYIKGWGGIRIEDIIIVEKDGPNQVMSRLPKDLLELD